MDLLKSHLKVSFEPECDNITIERIICETLTPAEITFTIIIPEVDFIPIYKWRDSIIKLSGLTLKKDNNVK